MLTWWYRRQAARLAERERSRPRQGHGRDWDQDAPGAIGTWRLADGTVQVESLRNGEEVAEFRGRMALDDRAYELVRDPAPPADMDSPDYTDSPTYREDDRR